MPRRNHLHAPLPPLFRSTSFHAQWASKMVDRLNDEVLPESHVPASPVIPRPRPLS